MTRTPVRPAGARNPERPPAASEIGWRDVFGLVGRALRRLGPERGDAAPSSRRWLLVSLGVLLLLLAGALAFLAPRSEGRELSLDALRALANEGRVVDAQFMDEDARVAGTYADGDGGRLSYWAAYPRSDTATGLLIDALIDGGARVEVDPQTTKGVVRLLATVLLPLMVLANLFALLFGAGGSSGIGDIVSFGRLGKKDARASTGVSFDDVAGAGEAVTELREVVDYLADPTRYEALGASPPKGVLLFGPPGCGKTLLAKAVAGEAGVPFFSVAGAEFVESLVGIGAARVRDLFRRVRAAAPAIVFIDELDAAGRRRGGADGGGADEREQTLNQLLVEMDGFDVSTGIVVMAATNRPDILDPALLRPGRFDRHVTVEPPDVDGRRQILALHTRGKPVAGKVDLTDVARRTPGFTGADLANVVNEAALLAIRDGRLELGPAEFEEAIDRVLSGPRRRGHVLREDERERIAWHEAGHAVVAARTGHPVRRISLVARGRGLATVALHLEDEVVASASALRARLAVLLGGTAAEELVFGEGSTGAEDDLAQATALARDVVGRYGLGRQVGRARILSADEDRYLGGTAVIAPLSPAYHERLDDEIRSLLDESCRSARTILEAERPLLDRLAARLLQEETLDEEAVAILVGGDGAAGPVRGSAVGSN